jgi:hypothetical protein
VLYNFLCGDRKPQCGSSFTSVPDLESNPHEDNSIGPFHGCVSRVTPRYLFPSIYDASKTYSNLQVIFSLF